MAWFLHLIINIFTILLLGYFFQDSFPVNGFGEAFLFLVILTVLNWTIIPILKLFTFPLNFLTLGLLGFLINGLGVIFAGSILGIEIKFIPALVVSLVLALVNGLAKNLYKEE